MMIIEEMKIIRDIPAIISRRNDNSKKPLVILSHGFTQSKYTYSTNGYLKELAELGYYAVAIDNRLHGDRPGPDFHEAVLNSSGEIDLLALRIAMKETADDVKMLIDDLSILEEVDEERIAMIGVSMGGFITYRAIVTDDRIKVGIPIISSPFWDDIPGDVIVRANSEAELSALYEEYQPSKYMNLFYPTALLIQVGEMDQHYNLSKVKKFYEDLASYYLDAPDMIKLIVYPDTKHEFKHAMWEQALQWLKSFL